MRGTPTTFVLQWGHAFVSVETRLTKPLSGRSAQLQWGHAFVSVETQRADRTGWGVRSASMGPRFCKRGNMAWTWMLAVAPSLQWGHAFVSVETRPNQNPHHRPTRASMGPRFCKRGNFLRALEALEALLASMGPRFCKRGNEPVLTFVRCTWMLQWGHAFVSVETMLSAAHLSALYGASMGPRFCKRGNRRWRGCAGLGLGRFNGATLL